MSRRDRIRRHATHFAEQLQHRRESEQGATIVLVAVALAVLMPICVAFTVNLGQQVDLNRSLQQVADSGAIYAAAAAAGGGSSGTILTEAQKAVTQDGLTVSASPTAAWPSVYLTEASSSGTWSLKCGWNNATCTDPNKITTTGITITAQASQNNLVHVFGNSSTLKRSAIAAVVPQAGFSIGTSLASFSSSQMAKSIPVLGALLNSIGASSNFSAVGYNGLAAGNVTLQHLITASGGVLTPSNILTLGYTPAGWATLLELADPALPQSVTFAGTTTAGCTPNNSSCLSLNELINLSPATPGNIVPASELAATVNILQTLTTAAELANGGSGISLTSALNLLLVGNISLTLNVISPPTVAFGPVGTTATNGQVNATLSFGGLLGIVGNVSVAVTGATGTATLTGVNCTNATLNTVQIAGVTTAASTTVTVLGIATNATLTGASSTTKTFNASAIPPTTSTQTASGNNQNPQTIGATAPSLTTGSLLSILSITALTGFLTGNLIMPVFNSLGVSLANADIDALSANCSSVSIVG